MTKYTAHTISVPDPRTNLPILIRLLLPPYLSQRFHPFIDNFTIAPADVPLLLCLPVDRTHLPEEIQTNNWPSIRHKEAPCYTCRQPLWVGPEQAVHRGLRVCFYCVELRTQILAAAGVPVEYDLHHLNDADATTPRRRY